MQNLGLNFMSQAATTGHRDPSILFDAQLKGSLLVDNISGSVASYTAAGSRSYIATDGTVKIAQANTPRFETSGLLCEPAATNLLEHLDDFGNAYWNKVGLQPISAVDNITAAGLTLQKIVEDTSTGEHRLAKISVIPVGAYTLGVPVLNYGRTRISLSTGTQFSRFDLSTLTPYCQTGIDSAWVERLSDNVCICWITSTSASTGTWQLYLRNEDDASSYTGDGVSGLYVGQPQLIAGSTRQSLILGSGAGTTSRVSDMGAASWAFADLHPDLAALLAGTGDCTVLAKVTPYASHALLSVSSSSGMITFNGVGTRGIRFYRSSGGDGYLQTVDASAFIISTPRALVTETGFSVAAIRASSDLLGSKSDAGSWNWTTGGTIGSFAVGNSIGIGVSGTIPFAISEIIIFNRALSQEEIEAMI